MYDKADVWRDWARVVRCLGRSGPGHVGHVFFGCQSTHSRRAGVGGAVDPGRRRQERRIGQRRVPEVCLYLQVQSWPVLGGDDLKKVVALLKAAAERLHRCGGNWFKIFRLFDDDDSGPYARPVLRCASEPGIADGVESRRRLLSCCPTARRLHAIKTTPSTPSARERRAAPPRRHRRAREHAVTATATQASCPTRSSERGRDTPA